jgi:hypothetical protein
LGRTINRQASEITPTKSVSDLLALLRIWRRN